MREWSEWDWREVMVCDAIGPAWDENLDMEAWEWGRFGLPFWNWSCPWWCHQTHKGIQEKACATNHGSQLWVFCTANQQRQSCSLPSSKFFQAHQGFWSAFGEHILELFVYLIMGILNPCKLDRQNPQAVQYQRGVGYPPNLLHTLFPETVAYREHPSVKAQDHPNHPFPCHLLLRHYKAIWPSIPNNNWDPNHHLHTLSYKVGYSMPDPCTHLCWNCLRLLEHMACTSFPLQQQQSFYFEAVGLSYDPF